MAIIAKDLSAPSSYLDSSLPISCNTQFPGRPRSFCCNLNSINQKRFGAAPILPLKWEMFLPSDQMIMIVPFTFG